MAEQSSESSQIIHEMPKMRFTARNLAELNRRATKKYGKSVPINQVVEENPDWIAELKESKDSQEAAEALEARAVIETTLKETERKKKKKSNN